MSDKLTYTPEQQAAITTRGGPLLVSAAAGSGKTKVLVSRLLSFLTDENEPCDISDFLVITYTRAAAAELKSKIRDALSEYMAIHPDDRHLRRQSALVYTARIGTIHSFCTELLRENAHLGLIPPDFRIADENECRLLKERVLSDVLDQRYEAIISAPGFALLVDTLSAGRDDSRLVEVILDAHTKLKSHADPAGWVKTQLDQLALVNASDASETLWGRYLIADARDKAVYWRCVLSDLLSASADCGDFMKAYGGSVGATVESLDGFINALDLGWDAACEQAAIAFPRAGNLKGYDHQKAVRTRCKAALKKVSEVFEYTSAELFEDMLAVHPAVEELLKLVLDFDAAYAEEKKKRALADFSDQEHLTVRLLFNRETGEKTPLAEAVSSRFKEIFIDEYQDVNGIQELIFQAISRGGKNLFMVGDVKQSIYRFRLADPSIFLDKYKRYNDLGGEDEDTGRRIFMSTNFRSKKAVLDAVNFVFKNIMSESFGEMDYTEKEYLNPGRADAESDGTSVELDVLDLSAIETEADEESPEKSATEAAFTARRIRQLLDEGLMIPDGAGNKRRASYGDFAILLRSVKNKAGVYAEALSKLGIPVGMSAGEGFFESLEVSVALAILDIIDNPRQDVPLITALRSPVYGFTADELASIRVTDKKGLLYDALVAAAKTDEKCRSFISRLDALRIVAPDMTTDRLLFRIYSETDMLAVMGALRDGEARRENLMKLMELAARYEANGLNGLFGFMTFVRRLIENGDEPFNDGGLSAGDAVKIMSIHKSKGLEFPVVILADTTKQFNTTDTKKPLLMHADLGVGMKRTDINRRIAYTTLPRMAVSRKLYGEIASEELRVLYVAMTRARERLIIVASFKDARRELDKLSQNAAAPAAPQVLETLNCYAGFILTPVLTRPEAACLRTEDVPVIMADDEPWDIRLVAAEKPGTTEKAAVENVPERVSADPEDVETLRGRLRFKYPYENAMNLPSKLTATELKGRFTDLEAAEEAESSAHLKSRPRPYDRPVFITEKTRLTATERGTALHLAMQFINYENCTQVAGVRQELGRLRERNFLSDKQLAAIDPIKIAAFFGSPLGENVLTAEKLYREFKFSLLVRPEDFYDGLVNSGIGQDDEILLQGVVDCCYERNGRLHIIDFKTDDVTPETIEAKRLLYTGQIRAYGRALERIIQKPVERLILYFFATGDAAEVSFS